MTRYIFSMDKRFYIGPATFREGVCLQYLSPGGTLEYCKLYLANSSDALTMTLQIREAETKGRS